MSAIMAGRFTAQMDEPFVVFLFGLRVNKPLAFKKWRWITRAFPQMVHMLAAHPEKGFLHGEQFFRFPPLTTIMVSYWRSFEDLERFARDKNDPHQAAWRRFNQEIGADGSMAVWHEIYVIEPGKYEVAYDNMPLFGLAGAAGHAVPVTSQHHNSARERLTQRDQPTSDPIVKS